MVLLAPPLIIDEEQMNDLIGILDASIGEVEQQLGLSG
jgi:adenosylmethionine-8-amino-7-oxononanoate aminotransferase